MMTRWLGKLILAAVVLGGAMNILPFCLDDASAQVRPSITKNVDEPGRIPYQQAFTSWRGGPDCAETYCGHSFPAVPANKRLVITNMFGTVYVSPAAQIWNITLNGGGAQFDVPINSAQYAANSSYSFNEHVQIFVDAGFQPHVGLAVAGYIGDNGNLWITLTGYLVDLSY
jgi:hypothetical protein